MQQELSGRVALVTGGSRGIGRAIALALAEAGAAVAVNYRRDAAAAAEVVQIIEAAGGTARAYQASVDDWAACDAMIDAIERDFGALSILIHNGGIASRGLSVHDTDIAEVERVIRVHAIAPHYLTKRALPLLRRGPRGDIVMISSIATHENQPNSAPYNMGKAAMDALAKTLAKEERQHGIRTNIVAPSLTVTDMGRRLVEAHGSSIERLDAGFPFGRVSRPEDVAAVVRFLVSAANAYVNGERIAVDGGGRT